MVQIRHCPSRLTPMPEPQPEETFASVKASFVQSFPLGLALSRAPSTALTALRHIRSSKQLLFQWEHWLLEISHKIKSITYHGSTSTNQRSFQPCGGSDNENNWRSSTDLCSDFSSIRNLSPNLTLHTQATLLKSICALMLCNSWASQQISLCDAGLGLLIWLMDGYLSTRENCGRSAIFCHL